MIKQVCEWESSRTLDLSIYFRTFKFFRAAQINDLANYLHASKLGDKGKVIGILKYNTYIAYAAGQTALRE
ncbi:hypothetical protein CLA18_18065 [Pseudomonas protegens]|nr:hypothetical protein CLA18_18065 [Pseudomonas protegens]